jgi:hypothetical protein
MKLLSNNYQVIKKTAQLESGSQSNLDKKTFEASKEYVDHLLGFMKTSFNLDQQFLDQTNIVGGYYFPYIYNDNRNSQLNIQFFKDYKKNFK